MSRAIDYDRAAEAIGKYEEFHRDEPKRIGRFPDSFQIPAHAYRAGRARWVTYRSTKVDPATLRKPRGTVDYIHEHDSRVYTYLTRSPGAYADRVDVPAHVRKSPALVRLGLCLGFCFEPPDDMPVEANGKAPFPDLYTTPCGKYLLVVQSRKTVLAMMWGGALGVFARGIDG